jgi:hypothetical protein
MYIMRSGSLKQKNAVCIGVLQISGELSNIAGNSRRLLITMKYFSTVLGFLQFGPYHPAEDAPDEPKTAPSHVRPLESLFAKAFSKLLSYNLELQRDTLLAPMI